MLSLKDTCIACCFQPRGSAVYVRRTWENYHHTIWLQGLFSTNDTSLQRLFSQSSQWSCIAFSGTWTTIGAYFSICGFWRRPRVDHQHRLRLEFAAFGVLSHSFNLPRTTPQPSTMMAVAAAQKNREMFAIKKSYSIEVSSY